MDNLYEIYIGDKTNPTYYFDNDDIVDLSSETAVNMIMEELSIDTLTFSVRYEYIESQLFKPTDYDAFESSDSLVLCSYGNSDITGIEWGAPVWLFSNGVQISKFYIDTVKRTGKYEYQIECVSFVGLLDKQTFYGDVYSNKTFSSLANEIIISDGIAKCAAYDSLNVYGYNYTYTSYQGWSSPLGKLKIHFTFRYDGIVEDLTGTSDTLYFYGCSDTRGTYYPYLFYADISRDSESSAWNTPRLDFKYGTQTIQGVNLVEGTVYEISTDPINGKLTINDSEFSFTLETFPAVIQNLNMCSAAIVKADGLTYTYYGKWLGAVCGYESWSYNSSSSSYGSAFKLIPAFNFSTQKYGLAVATMPTVTYYFYQSSTRKEVSAGNQITYDSVYFKKVSDVEIETLCDLEFDTDVSSIEVYGWLPICTRREALQQLLFAYSVNLIKSDNGNLIFTWIYDTDETIAIPDNDIFNEGEVEYEELVTETKVTEYSYVNDTSVSTEVVFDNTSGTAADKLLVTFDKPYYFTNNCTGSITYDYHNANCIIVSGQGTASMRPYTCRNSYIVRRSSSALSGSSVSVSNVNLITLQNSENVADRVFNYYSTKRIVKNAIAMTSQTCGKKYSFHNKFMDTTTAYLHKMSINATNILKANCEYVANYHPVGTGGNYSKAIILTGDGTWTVPEEVFEKSTPRIRVVLIGGGHGGSSGYAGATGNVGSTTGDTTLYSGEGGEKGTSGAGGNIYQFTIDEDDLLSSYQYSCGDGGDGGAECTSHTVANDGEDGDDTTFGSYSSASGASLEDGVTNMFNGITYAKTPENLGYEEDTTTTTGTEVVYRVTGCSTQGGSGGSKSNDSYESALPWWLIDYGQYRLDMIDGEDSSAAYTNNMFYNLSTPYELRVRFEYNSGSYWWYQDIDGGHTGGSAIGANGASGTASSWKSYPTQIQLGNGGKGADARDPITIDEYSQIQYRGSYGDTKYPYGFGGLGGNGGGGGGSSASGASIYGGYATCYAGTPGDGGKGSAGGKGAKGCVIVYY